jgi:leader peptidase (prepilin peptidase) / N-methyltransferase
MLPEPIFLGMSFAFVLGAIIGSFINVCVYRLPRRQSVLWPPSHCASCLHTVRWCDNIPLLSYVILRGRCRACGISFSSRYFWIELLAAISFAASFGIAMTLETSNSWLR